VDVHSELKSQWGVNIAKGEIGLSEPTSPSKRLFSMAKKPQSEMTYIMQD